MALFKRNSKYESLKTHLKNTLVKEINEKMLNTYIEDNVANKVTETIRKRNKRKTFKIL